jgi:hypothetical protein
MLKTEELKVMSFETPRTVDPLGFRETPMATVLPGSPEPLPTVTMG